MYYEIIILGVIIYGVMFATGQISFSKLVSDNEAIFRKLKESDWDFYVKAKYGNAVNPDILFNKRVRNGLITLILAFLWSITGGFSAIKIVIACAAGYGVFKITYMNLKSYYRKHIAQIDSLLPHYLKSIEILIQHYTVPVAIAGRVLAYCWDSDEKLKIGDAVCSGPNGGVSKMKKWEKILHPECIIGYVSEIPQYEIWGQHNTSVRGRVWIRVK